MTTELRIYKKRDKRRFVSLRPDYDPKGAALIVPPEDAPAIMAEDPSLVATDVWKTQAEYEGLKEFEGW